MISFVVVGSRTRDSIVPTYNLVKIFARITVVFDHIVNIVADTVKLRWFNYINFMSYIIT